MAQSFRVANPLGPRVLHTMNTSWAFSLKKLFMCTAIVIHQNYLSNLTKPFKNATLPVAVWQFARFSFPLRKGKIMHTGMSPIIAMVIPCPICQQWPCHPECPYDNLMRTARNHHRLDCPTCGKHEVDRNEMDFWECRSCHTQFCSSGIADTANPQKLLLITNLDSLDGYEWVYVMEKKGKKKFPHDQLVKNLKKLNAAFKRKMRQ